ncbi:MAG: aldehyde ferredoxin oxidoreductase family protein [Nitrososphaerota archaeon]|nr:aldehyde ferredoxin oxidoreductase family protein [Nitrososphaerota archaeon]
MRKENWISTLSRVLYIDLARKDYWVEDHEDLFGEWLGGIGVATKLYEEEVPRNADPLGPENSIIFTVGPLTAIYPMASKTVAVFKSPLNNNFSESHAGGRSASAIRFAGYGAIIIRNASERPVYLIIESDKVRFRDAGALWGVRSAETVGRILREVTGGAGLRSIMRIGGAGERLVRYASVMVETFRHFGRMGLGAVFGSKKLKAIVIIAGKNFKIPNLREYREVRRELYELTRGPGTKKYHDLGTAENVIPLNVLGALPTRNFSGGKFEGAEEISGEKLAEMMLARRVACVACPVACIHLAAIREEYEEEKFLYKTEFISYDYEPIYALGTNLGISDRFGLLKMLKAVEDWGLDAISTGVALSWATEAFERGIINKDEILVPLKWGDWKAYMEAVKNIVMQPNEFYRTLALGVEEAAKRYGGEEFALSFNKVEPAGYLTGPLYFISLAVGSRHSHLDAGSYSLDQKIFSRGEKLPKPEEAVRMIAEEEAWRQILTSLTLCLFARSIYTPEKVSKALNAIGYSFTPEELKQLGWKIYLEKQRIKRDEGFRPTEMRLPERIFETPTPLGKISKEYFQQALSAFEEVMRKWV